MSPHCLVSDSALVLALLTRETPSELCLDVQFVDSYSQGTVMHLYFILHALLELLCMSLDIGSIGHVLDLLHS